MTIQLYLFILFFFVFSFCWHNKKSMFLFIFPHFIYNSIKYLLTVAVKTYSCEIIYVFWHVDYKLLFKSWTVLFYCVSLLTIVILDCEPFFNEGRFRRNEEQKIHHNDRWLWILALHIICIYNTEKKISEFIWFREII